VTEVGAINKKRILLVENDAIIAPELVYALEQEEQEGHAAHHSRDVDCAK
jgi:hypothetical protein